MFIEELINPIVMILLVAMVFSFVVGENPKRLTKEEVEINVKNYTDAMDALRVEVDEFVNSKKKKKKAK